MTKYLWHLWLISLISVSFGEEVNFLDSLIDRIEKDKEPEQKLETQALSPQNSRRAQNRELLGKLIILKTYLTTENHKMSIKTISDVTRQHSPSPERAELWVKAMEQSKLLSEKHRLAADADFLKKLDSFKKRAREICLEQKDIQALDTLIIEITGLPQLSSSANNTPLQMRNKQKLDSIVQTLSKFATYLEFFGSEQYEQAKKALVSLNELRVPSMLTETEVQNFLAQIPNEKNLEEELKKPYEYYFNLADLKSSEEIAEKIAKLKADGDLNNTAWERGERDFLTSAEKAIELYQSGQYKLAYSQLREQASSQEKYKKIKGILLEEITISLVEQLSKIAPESGESSVQYIKRTAHLFQKEQNYGKAAEILGYYASSKNPNFADRSAFSKLVTAKRFVDAGDPIMALDAYRTIIKSERLEIVDKSIAENAIKKLIGTHENLAEETATLILERLERIEKILSHPRYDRYRR